MGIFTLCVYAGLCVWSRLFVYAVLCLTARKSPACIGTICCLLFEFKHLQCGLQRPASYTDRAIHAFPNNMWRPPGPEMFSSEF